MKVPNVHNIEGGVEGIIYNNECEHAYSSDLGLHARDTDSWCATLTAAQDGKCTCVDCVGNGGRASAPVARRVVVKGGQEEAATTVLAPPRAVDVVPQSSRWSRRKSAKEAATVSPLVLDRALDSAANSEQRFGRSAPATECLNEMQGTIYSAYAANT
eukprot:6202510-Pleurochrysis_carterae.AAC.1